MGMKTSVAKDFDKADRHEVREIHRLWRELEQGPVHDEQGWGTDREEQAFRCRLRGGRGARVVRLRILPITRFADAPLAIERRKYLL